MCTSRFARRFNYTPQIFIFIFFKQSGREGDERGEGEREREGKPEIYSIKLKKNIV